MPFLLKPPAFLGVVIEAVYSSIVFLICFMLFYKIRKIYKLADYKGFYLFSNTFLYLGLAYFLRFVVSIILISDKTLNLEFSFTGIKGLAFFSLVFMTYSSSAAILYLISSLIWKWFDKVENDLIIHIIAISIAVSPILWKSFIFFIVSQIFLLLMLILSIVINYLNRKRISKRFFSQAYIIYILLFVFWILNLSLLLRIIPLRFRGLIYLLSLLVIGLVAYKILKKI